MDTVAPDRLRHVLAYVDGTPAGAGSLFVTGGTAGIYNVATLAAARGRGVGHAVTAWLMNDARARGCTDAILHASDAGQRLYERLGFSRVCTVPQYVWMP
jgi:ribosomal protein S18 acetylase RimI-like enzyme